MIYPSILTDSMEVAQIQLNAVAGKVEVVQLDLIDAAFADEITITPIDATAFDFHGLRADLHIQTNEPIDELFEAQNMNQTLRTVIGQVERMSSQREFIDEVKAMGYKAGLSLDLFTPISTIADDLWPSLDVVQVMAIYAGKQEQEFQLSSLKKIVDVREYIRSHGLQTELIVDGGITPTTATQCKAAGADSFAVGSFLWKAKDISEAIFSLQQVK